MQNINIICIGSLKEKYLRDACAEYEKRLSRYCKFSITEIPEHRTADNPSDAQIAETLNAEGKRIIEKIPKGSYVVTMCIEGKLISSEKFAETLQNTAVNGFSSIVFVIGGSWGLSTDVKQMSDLRMSMSPMTFPHQLARVLLCEQIYRGFNINNSGKYHK